MRILQRIPVAGGVLGGAAARGRPRPASCPGITSTRGARLVRRVVLEAAGGDETSKRSFARCSGVPGGGFPRWVREFNTGTVGFGRVGTCASGRLSGRRDGRRRGARACACFRVRPQVVWRGAVVIPRHPRRRIGRRIALPAQLLEPGGAPPSDAEKQRRRDQVYLRDGVLPRRRQVTKPVARRPEFTVTYGIGGQRARWKLWKSASPASARRTCAPASRSAGAPFTQSALGETSRAPQAIILLATSRRASPAEN